MPLRRTGWRRRRASLLLIGSLTLGACTSAPGPTSPAAPTTAERSTTTTTPTPTTTTTPTTPTTIAQPQQQDDRRQILELHRRFLTEYFDRDDRTVDFDEQRALLRELAVDPLLTRGLDTLDRNEASDDFIVSPGHRSNVFEVRLQGDTASVLDCSEDQSELLAADGSVLIERDNFYKFRELQYVRTPDGWKISEFLAGGDLRCDPDDPDYRDRRQIYQVHTRFMTEFFARDERTDDPETRRRLIDELAIDPELTRNLNAIDRSEQATTYVISTGFVSHIHLLQLEPDRAFVVDCAQNTSIQYNADGDVLRPRDESFVYRQVELTRTDSGWKVTRLLNRTDETCDPEDLPTLSY